VKSLNIKPKPIETVWPALLEAFETYWKWEDESHDESNAPLLPEYIKLQNQLYKFQEKYSKNLHSVPKESRRESYRAIIQICSRHNFDSIQLSSLIEGLGQVAISKSITVGIGATEKKGEPARSLAHIVKSLERIVAFANEGTDAGPGADREAMVVLKNRHKHIGKKRLDVWNGRQSITGENQADRFKVEAKQKRARLNLLALGIEPEEPSFSPDGMYSHYSMFEVNHIVPQFFSIAHFMLQQAKIEIANHQKLSVVDGAKPPNKKGKVRKPIQADQARAITIKLKELFCTLTGKCAKRSRSSSSGKLSENPFLKFIGDCRTALGFSKMNPETIISHVFKKQT
jgi:hypothetical protein